VDALAVLQVALLALFVLRSSRWDTLTEMTWTAVVVLTVGRSLSTSDHPGAFFRLLLLAVAWIAYALAYRYHARIAATLPYAAILALAASLAMLLTRGFPLEWAWDRNVTADVLLLLIPWLHEPVLLALGLVAVVLTGSRGAWLGLAGALVWLIARPRWYVWAAVVGALAVGLVFIRPATVNVRLGIWAEAARMIAARPLTGWGIGAQIVTETGAHFHAHNILIDALVNGGVLLAAAWGMFLYSVIKLIGGPAGSRARLGLAAVMIHGLVDCEVWTPAIVLMAVNLALLVRYRESETSVAPGDSVTDRVTAAA